MTPGQLDAYVSRLERALRQRGLDDARIVEEAREHLVDAVDEGLQRGLSIEDAEQEAFERFGAPDVVAAHAVLERGLQMNRFAAVLATVWHHKWWILVPTILTAVLTSAMSYYLLPLRYRSEALIGIVPPIPAAQYVRTADTDRARERFQHLRQVVLSRTRLEKMISDFGLYQLEQKRAPLVEIVQQMRRDIDLTFVASDHAQDSGIDVSFVSSDPEMAFKVAERLASNVILENIEDANRQANAATSFIGGQIDDVRKRLIAYEITLEGLRARSGRRPLSQADTLPYEVLQERYKALLNAAEEARMVQSLERRMIGEQFKIFEGARRPERPVGPSRFRVNVAGAFAGLGLGLVLVTVVGSSKKRLD